MLGKRGTFILLLFFFITDFCRFPLTRINTELISVPPFPSLHAALVPFTARCTRPRAPLPPHLGYVYYALAVGAESRHPPSFASKRQKATKIELAQFHTQRFERRNLVVLPSFVASRTHAATVGSSLPGGVRLVARTVLGVVNWCYWPYVLLGLSHTGCFIN
jgi:hypothetical protein